MRLIAIGLLAGSCVALFAIICWPSPDERPDSLSPTTASAAPTTKPPQPAVAFVPKRTTSADRRSETIRTSDAIFSEVRTRLVRDGWDAEAAERVARLNTPWFTELANADGPTYRRQLGRLAGLTDAFLTGNFLCRHPEAAALLAMTAEPAELARSLEGPDYPMLVGLFVPVTDRAEFERLAKAVTRDGPLVARLTRQGLLGGHLLFCFNSDGPGVEAYREWLRDRLLERLDDRGENAEARLVSFFHLALVQGPTLLDRLNTDSDFRADFPRMWRNLERLADEKGRPLELYLDLPGLWDVLRLKDGFALLERLGDLPVRLLHGPTGYHERHHAKVLELLRTGEEHDLHALVEFRGERLFHEWLDADVEPGLRSAGHQKLLESEDPLEQLRVFLRFTGEPDVLAKEIGPKPDGAETYIPLYDTYYAFEKLADGRDVSTGEAFWAVADPVTFILPIARGGKVAKEIGKAAVRKTAGKVARKTALEWSEKWAKAGRKYAAEHLSDDAAKMLAGDASRYEAAKWGVSAQFSRMSRSARGVWGKPTGVEITSPVRFLYGYSGVGRDSLKTLDRLEAKLYLRGDTGPLVSAKGLSHEVGRQFLEQTLQRALEAPEESSPSEQRRAWREHVSAWWLMSADFFPNSSR